MSFRSSEVSTGMTKKWMLKLKMEKKELINKLFSVNKVNFKSARVDKPRFTRSL